MIEPDTDRARQRLAHILEKQRAALQELGHLLSARQASAAAIDQAQVRINRLNAEYARLVQDLKLAQLEAPGRYGAYRSRAGQRPMRELVLDIIDELGVPCPPRVVSEFALACMDLHLPVARFASLRRDEERAYRKEPGARPAWVVPAVSLIGFSAIPRLVASSVWELERRLIGPRTLRVNHLKTQLAILRRLSSMGTSDKRAASDLGAMLYRYARNVPGALSWGEEPDLDRIRTATEAELRALEPADVAERTLAARGLAKHPAQAQLWGLPIVLDGGGAPRATSPRGMRQKKTVSQ